MKRGRPRDSLVIMDAKDSEETLEETTTELVVRKIKDERLEISAAEAAKERVPSVRMPASMVVPRRPESDKLPDAGTSLGKKRPGAPPAAAIPGEKEDRLQAEKLKKRRIEYSSLPTQALNLIDPRDLPFICGDKERGIFVLNTTKSPDYRTNTYDDGALKLGPALDSAALREELDLIPANRVSQAAMNANLNAWRFNSFMGDRHDHQVIDLFQASQEKKRLETELAESQRKMARAEADLKVRGQEAEGLLKKVVDLETALRLSKAEVEGLRETLHKDEEEKSAKVSATDTRLKEYEGNLIGQLEKLGEYEKIVGVQFVRIDECHEIMENQAAKIKEYESKILSLDKDSTDKKAAIEDLSAKVKEIKTPQQLLEELRDLPSYRTMLRDMVKSAGVDMLRVLHEGHQLSKNLSFQDFLDLRMRLEDQELGSLEESGKGEDDGEDS